MQTPIDSQINFFHLHYILDELKFGRFVRLPTRESEAPNKNLAYEFVATSTADILASI